MLSGLPFLRDARRRRTSSYDTTGGNADATVGDGDGHARSVGHTDRHSRATVGDTHRHLAAADGHGHANGHTTALTDGAANEHRRRHERGANIGTAGHVDSDRGATHGRAAGHGRPLRRHGRRRP